MGAGDIDITPIGVDAGARPSPTALARRWRRGAAGAAIAAAALAVCGGCEIAGLAAVMADTYKRTGSHEVLAEYTGLEGKTFAVVVAADRIIQGEHRSLVPTMMAAVADRLAANVNASGFVPPMTAIEYTTNNPRWTAMTYGELAKDLGVERLIYVDVADFRINEPGNAHVWNGVATANVGVVEADGALPDDFAYIQRVSVSFPDGQGYTREDMDAGTVVSRLRNRLIDRVTWLFFDHDEKNMMDY